MSRPVDLAHLRRCTVALSLELPEPVYLHYRDLVTEAFEEIEVLRAEIEVLRAEVERHRAMARALSSSHGGGG